MSTDLARVAARAVLGSDPVAVEPADDGVTVRTRADLWRVRPGTPLGGELERRGWRSLVVALRGAPHVRPVVVDPDGRALDLGDGADLATFLRAARGAVAPRDLAELVARGQAPERAVAHVAEDPPPAVDRAPGGDVTLTFWTTSTVRGEDRECVRRWSVRLPAAGDPEWETELLEDPGGVTGP